jgi:glutaminyl-peptide cyclotransferase
MIPHRALPRCLLGLVLATLAPTMACVGAVPLYTFEIVNTYPHDAHAFTEGLFYLNGFLYESTGLEHQSSIRKVELESGKVIQQFDVPGDYFGEGIVNWGPRLISLTWRSHVGFVHDLASFRVQGQFSYTGEGWGLTQDGRRIIMSDGTAELRFIDPRTLKETGKISANIDGRPVRNLNELEWVKGEIYANVWQTNWIVRINPDNGQIVGVIQLDGILPASKRVLGQTDVLNGIAYDPERDRLFVTGKNWPNLFEIRLLKTGEIGAASR